MAKVINSTGRGISKPQYRAFDDGRRFRFEIDQPHGRSLEDGGLPGRHHSRSDTEFSSRICHVIRKSVSAEALGGPYPYGLTEPWELVDTFAPPLQVRPDPIWLAGPRRSSGGRE